MPELIDPKIMEAEFEVAYRKAHEDHLVFSDQNDIERIDWEKTLANILHKLFCGWNHTEGCDWYYGDWSDKKTPSYGRNKYLTKAKAIFQLEDYEPAVVVRSYFKVLVYKTLKVER